MVIKKLETGANRGSLEKQELDNIAKRRASNYLLFYYY